MTSGADEAVDGGVRSIAFLQVGFRPFFLLGALWAGVAIPLWMGLFQGWIGPPLGFDSLAWHGHEMLFGYTGAVICGFLLTAVPNWTGRPFLKGAPLAVLAVMWIAGRLTVALSAEVGVIPAMVVEAGLFLVVAVWAWRQIRIAGNRNIPMPILIALFGLAAAASHAAALGAPVLADLAFRLGLAIIIVLISLIGGRIVPAFTKNWLVQSRGQGPLPTLFNRFDGAVIAASGLALLVWTIAPASVLSGWLLLVAAVMHAARLARWSGWRTGGEPLVFILHLSYAWVPVGLALLGASILFVTVPYSAALHALTAGAIGAMTLAVMTRASLGHTGRSLTAGIGEMAIYTLVHGGAILRVASPFFADASMALLMTASWLWAGAFLLFVLIYGPILTRPARE